MEKTKKWMQFEREIEQIYSENGYRTRRDVLIRGQQIDILVERSHPGMGVLKVAIECKYLSKGSVKNQDVHDFVNFINGVGRSEGISSGIIVTNQDFSRFAKQSAEEEAFVHLFTIDKLRQSMFPILDGLQSYIAEYLDRSISQNYIDVKSVNHTSNRGQQALKEIMKFGLTQSGQMPVLGDFGSGKTTVLERTRYEISRMYLAEETVRIPIFYRLRDMQNFRHFEEFVVHSFRQNFLFRVQFELISQKSNEGKFCHLFDGFDEIDPQSTQHERFEHARIIDNFAGNASASIISSRETYFVTREECNKAFRKIDLGRSEPIMRSLIATENEEFISSFLDTESVPFVSQADTNPISLIPLDDKDIEDFLKSKDEDFQKKAHVGWKEVLNFLKSIYDLGDLVRRPILLRMVVDSIIGQIIDLSNPDEGYGPYKLYDLYTWASFSREFSKGKKKERLSPEVRRQFAQELATSMMELGQLTISGDVIAKAAHQHDRGSNIRFDIENEDMITDFRSSTFLEFSSDATFRFAHRSFMEFFVAQAFCSNLASKVANLDSRTLPGEAIYFAASNLDSNPHLKLSAIGLLEKAVHGSGFRKSIEGCLLSSAEHCAKLEIGSGILEKLKVRSQKIVEFSFQDSSFSHCAFSDVSFDTIKMEDVSFVDCMLDDCNVINSRIGVEFIRCSLDKIRIEDSQASLYFRDGSISEISLTRSDISISGDVSLIGGTLKNVELNTISLGSTNCVLTLLRCNFESVGFLGKSKSIGFEPEVSVGSGNKFHDCFFRSLCVDFGDSLSSETVSTPFSNCKGVILVSSTLSKKEKSDLVKGNPLLVMIEARLFSEARLKRTEEDQAISEIRNQISLISIALDRAHENRDELLVDLFASANNRLKEIGDVRSKNLERGQAY